MFQNVKFEIRLTQFLVITVDHFAPYFQFNHSAVVCYSCNECVADLQIEDFTLAATTVF